MEDYQNKNWSRFHSLFMKALKLPLEDEEIEFVKEYAKKFTEQQGMSDNAIQLLKEDKDCVHIYLDDLFVPRVDDKEQVLSLVGRISFLRIQLIKDVSAWETKFLKHTEPTPKRKSNLIIKQNEGKLDFFWANLKYLGYAYQEVDGFYVFQFNSKDGVWSDYALREITDKLFELNKDWAEQIDKYFRNAK